MNALRNTLAAAAAAIVLPAWAQVPVDDSGQAIGDFAPSEAAIETGNEGIPLLGRGELEDLVGPVALYPDDLLAIVLPASTFPLQLVEAQRFLEDLEDDPVLKPDDDWDDSVIALLNYPEVLELLNEDLDWTWQLGEAVVAQHSDVVAAIEGFRNRAYAAGNLRSDERQTISDEDGAIQISPVDDDIIYVPYYEPERVVVYQPEPVVHYYPQAYPVYYYPYPSGHAFRSGFFWGVTSAYSLGWLSDRVHVIHHSYHSHPYYGRHYWDGWWYRRPSIHVHNHYYVNKRDSRRYYSRGDAWRPRYDHRRRLGNQRIVRSNYYARQNDRVAVTRATSTRYASQRQRQPSTTARNAVGTENVSSPRRERPARQATAPRRETSRAREGATARPNAQRQPRQNVTQVRPARPSAVRQQPARRNVVREQPSRVAPARERPVRQAPTREQVSRERPARESRKQASRERPARQRSDNGPRRRSRNER